MQLSDILLPYQKDLIKCKPTDKLIIRKSRRTGYTWAQSLRMTLDVMQDQPWNVISYRMESSKLVIEDCLFWVNKLCDLGFTKASDWERLKESITYKPNNRSVRALPCVPQVIRGKKGNVLIDEAAHIPKLKDILDAVRPLTIWGYGITMISSPYLPGLFEEMCDSGDWKVRSIDIWEAVDQGLYSKIRQEIGQPAPTADEQKDWVEGLLKEAGTSADHEYLCRVVSGNSGCWISKETKLKDTPVTIPVCDLPTLSMKPVATHTMGIDVGVADNPTFISLVGSKGIEGLIELRGKTIPQLARFISQLITAKTTKVVIDTNGIGRGLADVLAETHGKKVVYQPNTSQWINTQCVKFLSEVWEGTVEISSDELVLSDLSATQMLNGKLVMNSRTINGQNRHCDSIPSLAMAYQHASKSLGMYE